MSEWEIFHHTNKHGTRYQVNNTQFKVLTETVERGEKSIERFLTNHTGEPGKYKVLGTKRLRNVWGPMAYFHRSMAER